MNIASQPDIGFFNSRFSGGSHHDYRLEKESA